MPENIETIAAQIRTLLPLVQEVNRQYTAQELIKKDIQALKKYKIDKNAISVLKLELSEKQADYDKKIQKQFTDGKLENEKQFGIFRNKMVFYALIEKVIMAVIIAYTIMRYAK